jgi:hypothetical protein
MNSLYMCMTLWEEDWCTVIDQLWHEINDVLSANLFVNTCYVKALINTQNRNMKREYNSMFRFMFSGCTVP